jgi:hypothetical protein
MRKRATLAVGVVVTASDPGRSGTSASNGGLEGSVTAAHIHLGQEDGVGGVIAFLCGGGGKPACPQSGEIRGQIGST